eukprot:3340814-Amphidinium_carterae.1
MPAADVRPTECLVWKSGQSFFESICEKRFRSGPDLFVILAHVKPKSISSGGLRSGVKVEFEKKRLEDRLTAMAHNMAGDHQAVIQELTQAAALAT